MESFFVFNVSIILLSGLIAGWICKRFKVSPLIGYLLVGALIGPGGIDLTGSGALKRAFDLDQKLMETIKESDRETSDQPIDEESEEPEETSATPNGAEILRALASDGGVAPMTIREKVKLELELEASENKSRELEKELAKERNQRESEVLQTSLNEQKEMLEGATEFGVLLLLFAIGIEFTFSKLASTAKYMLVGGTIQMGATIALSILICSLFKMGWAAGLAIGSVIALSSTALVYKSLEDVGQADTRRAQATLGLLIFQDVALVPLLLILPIVLQANEGGEAVSYWFGNPWVDMTLKSTLFCVIVLFIKFANMKFIIERLARLRSNEMVILYAIVVLLAMCVLAETLGLTPALGALAAGIALGENRLTHQIDALILPFREAFSAMFFISLGMLTDFSHVFHHPIICILTLAGALAFKSFCASAALKACGMDIRGALAYGTSISQIGELAFMLLAVAHNAGAIRESVYDTMLFVSVASLVATPNLIKIAMTKFGMPPETPEASGADADVDPKLLDAIVSSRGHAIIVGAGHIGQSLANALISRNMSTCLVDFNPVNLHPFKQNGIPTVTGDGANYDVLREAGIGRANVVFVTVPRDDLALNVVKSVRALNPTAVIASRARYRLSVSQMERAGSALVLCEENYVADELVKLLAQHLEANPDPKVPEPTPA